MRKVIFTTIAGGLLLVACNENRTAGMKNSAAETNLNAAHAISRAFETGNLAAIDSFVADGFIDHTQSGDKQGKDSLKTMVKMIIQNMPGMKTETINEYADSSYVFQWLRFTGNSTGAFMPAGPYDMKSIELTRFENGKAVEHWTYIDAQEAMKMMASMQQPVANAPADTSKKVPDTTRRSTP